MQKTKSTTSLTPLAKKNATVNKQQNKQYSYISKKQGFVETITTA
jgi:hypothetical protein